MSIDLIIEQQKGKMLLHRIAYLMFVFIRILLQFENREILVRNTILSMVFVFLMWSCDEIFLWKRFFGNLIFAKGLRYGQCLLSIALMLFVQENDMSAISIIALVIMFLVDYFLISDVTDGSTMFSFMMYVGIPILIVLIFKLSVNYSNQWMFMFFDVILLFTVLFLEAFELLKYISKVDDKFFVQRAEMEHMVKENGDIRQMRDNLQKNNDVLNIQKIELQKANKQIREANSEMVVQAEILKYISMSFDVAKIANQITDSIMLVKKNLGFSAVYITENTYLNKNANYVIKTEIGQLQSKIRDAMDELYIKAVANNKQEIIYNGDIKDELPFLDGVNIHSVYIRLLSTNEGPYGLFMLGASKVNEFDKKMSFYDAIIAQYDITIHNAKIYNEMQHMAQKDGLTGINNRLYFIQIYKNIIKQIQAKNDSISVALFDIDKFKSVNDTYGHLAGDEVIKRIAKVTEECIEKYDGFICRYGGEEFVVALPNRKLEVAQPIIEELFEELCKQVVHFNEYDIPMSVSVGLTAYPEVCKNPDDLLKRADWCMYYAKEHGRHQINVDDGSIQRD